MTLISKFTRESDSNDESVGDADLESQVKPRDSFENDYCLMLTQNDNDEASIQRAWTSLGKQMALIPEGEVLMSGLSADVLTEIATLSAFEPQWVEGFYLDRTCVTNRQFAEFVDAGGYLEENLWPAEVLSNLLQFVDLTDSPGPANWQYGRPPQDRLDHPVSGISWYEANTYAHWRGKRLPSPSEWQWSAIWAGGQPAGVTQRRYPWGDSFDPSRCNTWNNGLGTTVPVTEFCNGCTPNGIYQLIGNVWEWTAALFECDPSSNGDRVLTEFPMAEIRGGAFDTYFASQATAQFRTGQSLLFRGANVGFRCCVSCDQLTLSSDPYSFLDGEES